MRSPLISCIVFLLLLTFSLEAQEADDFGAWGSVAYGAEVFDDLSFSIQQEVRMEDNASSIGTVFTNFAVDYRFNRSFRLGWNYRFILNRRATGLFGHRHRTMLDLDFRTKLRQWTFAYRARGQWEVRTNNYNNEFGFAPSSDFRNTFKVVYQYNRRIEYYSSFDLRILLRDPRIPSYQGVDRFRYRAGCEYLLAKEQSLGFFFQFQREINIPEASQGFVIGLEYKFGSIRPLMES